MCKVSTKSLRFLHGPLHAHLLTYPREYSPFLPLASGLFPPDTGMFGLQLQGGLSTSIVLFSAVPPQSMCTIYQEEDSN